MCFFLTSALSAMTLGQLKTEIRRNMRDTSSSSDDQRFTDATLRDFVNEAQREIVNTTWLSEKTTQYVLSPRTTYYDLPADCLAVYQIGFRTTGSNAMELDETSMASLRSNNMAWDTTTGSPFQYLITQSTFSSASSTSALKISYIPVPTATSTGTVTMRYYNSVDDLDQDSDVPFNGKRNLYVYHMAIVYHVSMRLKAIEGRGDESGFYAKMYSGAIAIVQGRINRMENYKPGVAAGDPNR